MIDAKISDMALNLLEVDTRGLDENDRTFIKTIVNKFSGGPVGLDTLAAAMSEERGTIEDVIEPFLIQQGFINRTPRGRVATDLTYHYLGLDNKN
jgi:Holliday junction DNA helicase RuvB